MLSSLRRYVVPVLLAVLVVGFLGRFLGLPYFLSLVATRSMEPAFRPLDVVVVMRTHEVSVGDVVLWCSGPAYCVLHRAINVTSQGVVTKGDNNPLPDKGPIPFNRVVGKAVAKIPREVVVLGFAFAAALALYSLLRGHGFGALASPVYLLLALYFLGSFGLVVLAPFALSDTTPTVVKPRLVVSSVSVGREGDIVIVFSENSNLEPVRIGNCSIRLTKTVEDYTGPREWRCYGVAGEKRVVLKVPLTAYYYANLAGSPSLLFEADIWFKPIGFMHAKGHVGIPYRTPCVRVESGVVEIANPNIYPLNVTVEKPLAGGREAKPIWRGVVMGEESVVLDFSNYTSIAVKISYVFKGKLRVLNGAVMVAGKPAKWSVGCPHSGSG